MEKFTRIKEKDIQEAIKEVKLFVYEINPKFISILKYKFSKTEYKKVANYQFKFWFEVYILVLKPFLLKIKINRKNSDMPKNLFDHKISKNKIYFDF